MKTWLLRWLADKARRYADWREKRVRRQLMTTEHYNCRCWVDAVDGDTSFNKRPSWASSPYT